MRSLLMTVTNLLVVKNLELNAVTRKYRGTN